MQGAVESHRRVRYHLSTQNHLPTLREYSILPWPILVDLHRLSCHLVVDIVSFTFTTPNQIAIDNFCQKCFNYIKEQLAQNTQIGVSYERIFR